MTKRECLALQDKTILPSAVRKSFEVHRATCLSRNEGKREHTHTHTHAHSHARTHTLHMHIATRLALLPSPHSPSSCPTQNSITLPSLPVPIEAAGSFYISSTRFLPFSPALGFLPPPSTFPLVQSGSLSPTITNSYSDTYFGIFIFPSVPSRSLCISDFFPSSSFPFVPFYFISLSLYHSFLPLCQSLFFCSITLHCLRVPISASSLYLIDIFPSTPSRSLYIGLLPLHHLPFSCITFP